MPLELQKIIVMTVINKNQSQCVHICGKAPANLQGGQENPKLRCNFGGNDPTDNSGTMIIRLEYTGFAFSPTKESMD